jgi:hypothetical protein
MNLTRQTRIIGIRFEDFLTALGISIAVSLFRRILEKVFKRLTVPFSYPLALFQVKFLIRVNSGLLSFTVPYASLQQSWLSPLAPIVGFYLWGIHRIIWTGFSLNIDTSLAQIVQHNHSREGKALTMASRSAKALAQVFSSPETEQSWVTAYTVSQMFYVSSTIIVQPNTVSTKPFSTRGTGTNVVGRSWSLSLALRLVMIIRKLSSSGTVQPRMGNHTSPKVSL